MQMGWWTEWRSFSSICKKCFSDIFIFYISYIKAMHDEITSINNALPNDLNPSTNTLDTFIANLLLFNKIYSTIILDQVRDKHETDDGPR